MLYGSKAENGNGGSGMWLIFALASAGFAGLTAILSKIGIKNTDSSVATALRTIVVLIFAWVMVFVTGGYSPLSDIEPRTLVFLILSGLATGASWLCYFRALQLGDVNKVTPIDKSSTVLTILLAAVFLGEEIGLYKAIAIVFIAVGTLLMITSKPSDKDKAKGGIRWAIYAVLSAVFAALTSILGKVGIQGIDSNLGTAIRTCVVLLMAWAVVFVTGKAKEVRRIDRRSLVFIALSGIATGGSWLCFYRALQTGDASVVVPVDKLSIIPTVLFSFIILKEKMSRKSIAGLVCVVGGTLLMLL